GARLNSWAAALAAVGQSLALTAASTWSCWRLAQAVELLLALLALKEPSVSPASAGAAAAGGGGDAAAAVLAALFGRGGGRRGVAVGLRLVVACQHVGVRARGLLGPARFGVAGVVEVFDGGLGPLQLDAALGVVVGGAWLGRIGRRGERSGVVRAPERLVRG